MNKYNDIKGAKELVETYHKDLNTIDKSLGELKEQKAELEKKIGDSSERFTLNSIEKNAKIKRDLNLVKQYIVEAESQKEQITKKNQQGAFKDVVAVLKAHKEENVYKHNDINKAMVEHLRAIRELNKDYKELERAEQVKINALISDMLVFLPETDQAGHVLNERSHNSNIKRLALNPSEQVFHKLPETVYGVKGALEWNKAIYMDINTPKVKAAQLNELYNVEPAAPTK